MHRTTDLLPTVDAVGRSGGAAPAARATDPVRPLVLASATDGESCSRASDGTLRQLTRTADGELHTSPGPGRTPSQHVPGARADGSQRRRTTDSTAQDRDPEAGRTRP